MTLEKALAALSTLIQPLAATHEVPLSEARGRVLAEDVVTALPLPPFPASAMDGYAVKSEDWTQGRTFNLIGQALAGHPFTGTLAAGDCVRIFTGAQVPVGADRVVLQEWVKALDERTITFDAVSAGESYIRPVGNDVAQGEIIAVAGTRLGPITIGSLAASGIAQVTVRQRPVIGVFSSGDELIDISVPPSALQPGQIYDSNRRTVMELLRNLPLEILDLGCLSDDPETIRTALQQAANRCDLLITSGGVSVGEADFITQTISDLGELIFWKLNIKPGKPLALGRIEDCWILGLPGNPVSTIVTALLVGTPLAAHLAGFSPEPPLRISAQLDAPLGHQPGRAEYQRGRYWLTKGEPKVRHTGEQGSNRLSTFRHANCLIEIPAESGDIPSGARVTILPFVGLMAEA